jgi:hypothetical protein
MDTTQRPPATGLQIVVDCIVAPKAAFERLKTSQTWGWAFAITAILGCIGIYLEAPTSRHLSVVIVQHLIATNPAIAGMTDAQKNQMLANAARPSPFSEAFSYINTMVLPLIASLFNALILLVGNAAGRGKADFGRLWSGSMNVAVPTIGLSSLVVGIITAIRGPESFNSFGDMFGAVPNLHYVVPVGGFFGNVLMSLNVFTLWGFGLNVVMMQTLAAVRGAVAWIFPALITVFGALVLAGFMAIFASFTGQ